MPCGRGILENGQSPHPALWRVGQTVTGANPIALSWASPTWTQMLQITANWSIVPALAGDLVLWKDHTGTAYDVDLLRIDPSVAALNITDWVCVENFVFEPGEIAKIDYPNPSGVTVGVELYFQQLDK